MLAGRGSASAALVSMAGQLHPPAGTRAMLSVEEVIALTDAWMTTPTEHQIREMVDAIVAEARPERVILFGSQARGDAGETSDVDFLVVDSGPFDEHRSRRHLCVRLYNAVAKFDIPTDILVYARREFDYWSDSLNHVVGRAAQEGKVLYERS